ncbi:hypothetical protein ACFWM0_18320 [Streptomyces sp. NPDC058405]|uniref:hypothetical protein n=1 Tax=Streptomyces sp. NPDC058405 TaxID=3346482 RepID=UPI0036682567
MRAIRAASAALLGVAAFALTTASSAAAVKDNATPFGYTVTPSTVAAGGKVLLAVTKCSTPATASSGVFDTVTIPSGSTAAATVDWDAKPGAKYEVTFTCNGVSAKTNLAIAAAAKTPTPAPTQTPAAPAATTQTPAQVATPAVGATSDAPLGVQGGVGGSIGGMNTAEIVAGTALVVAAATGTIYVARRRAESRRH